MGLPGVRRKENVFSQLSSLRMEQLSHICLRGEVRDNPEDAEAGTRHWKARPQRPR
jgi:hypothetical protein